MAVAVNTKAPDFIAKSSEGPIRFHDWIGDSWCALFLHPNQVGRCSSAQPRVLTRLQRHFERRRVKLLALSTDPVLARPGAYPSEGEAHPGYTLVEDRSQRIAKRFGMSVETARCEAGGRPVQPSGSPRKLCLISPDKLIKLTARNPMTSERDFADVLTAIDSLRLTRAINALLRQTGSMRLLV